LDCAEGLSAEHTMGTSSLAPKKDIFGLLGW
jgi:hypothetical protein